MCDIDSHSNSKQLGNERDPEEYTNSESSLSDSSSEMPSESNTELEKKPLTKKLQNENEPLKSLKNSPLSFLGLILLGQFLSLMISGTGISNQMLFEKYSTTLPTTENLLNYFLLFLVYGIKELYLARKNKVKTPILLYAVVGLVDTLGNFMFVKAYQKTTLISVMLLNCMGTPTIMLLSRTILKVRYNLAHFVSVFFSVTGSVILIIVDSRSNNNGKQDHKIYGDLLCVCGTVFYAISNVTQEYIIKKYNNPRQFLGMIGLFGSVCCSFILLVFQRNEFTGWKNHNYGFYLCLVGYALSMFFLYSFTPLLIKKSSAAFLSLSLITSNFYSLIVSVIIFKTQLQNLYFLSFVLVICGLIIFEFPQKWITKINFKKKNLFSSCTK
ncbi:anthocyanin-related membrane protein 2-related [Anaeramoeba flamelloides]|uniref:Anthocyanin-related membrane protein 2-related n=1 Tax=Anaeramoeba flamelloides TaxID=1746091 RepID=A0AAV8A1M2_9EUKA|nr:anthocyanin-related membrane protein 2-related [Anaeramoeba flamelloides]